MVWQRSAAFWAATSVSPRHSPRMMLPMKHKILGLSLFATLALGLVCAFQWRQLAETRQRLAKSEQTLQADLQSREEQDNKLKELQRQRDQLDRDVADLNHLAPSLRFRQSHSRSNLN